MADLGYYTALHEVALKDFEEIAAFCAQSGFELSVFFAAVWSIALRRYFEKDVLYIAINSDSTREFPGADPDGQMTVWRVALSPERAIQDLFEDRKTMTSVPKYPETEPETKGGIWLTGKKKATGINLGLPKSGLDVFIQQYEFLLVIAIGDGAAMLKLHHRISPLLEHRGRSIAYTVRQVAQLIVANQGRKVKDLDLFSPHDIDTVSQWNQKHRFQPEYRTIADVIHQQSLKRPDSLAIRAWDGELTYGQLDNVTNRVAAHLQREGVGAEVLVPVCFEKSLWAIVAELGILKAGGAFVPMDPSQPQHRLKQIIEQTSATLIVASAAQSDRLSVYGPKIITVFPGILSSGRLIDEGIRPASINSQSAAYVLFTSGSTGNSKGCVVDQSALAHITHHGEALCLSSKSRVLQFASYTFGVSLIEIFCSLTVGATLCIPSEQERMNNLVGYMSDMDINWAFLTPSTVNSINDPTLVPQLETLILAGEPMGQHHVEIWADQVELHQAYGLTEWAGICGVSPRIKGPGSNLETVGFSSPTANLWLADPADHNKLAPIGAVAELLIEGPSLARGYLNDSTKTADAFVDSPAWLYNFRPSGKGRVYKTGDLVQYQADGSFRYIARKDTQVKIRGKRLELGEVEYCVCQCCPAVTRAIAEAVVLDGCDGMPILLVFLCYQAPAKKENEGNSYDDNGGELLGSDSSSGAQFRSDVGRLKVEMPQSLPEHMVPAIYLPLRYIPLTLTGKIDRRKLRETMRQFTRETLESYSSEERQRVAPVTKTEITLHRLFAETLNVQPNKFGIHDSFLHLGGDSVKAMRLARVCQEHNLSLTVKDVLEIQTITKLASFSESKQQQPHRPEDGLSWRMSESVFDEEETSETLRETISKPSVSDSKKLSLPSNSTPAESLALLGLGSEDLEQLINKRLPALGISANRDVEDAFHCSPIQEGILISQARQPGNYEMRFIWEILPATYGQSVEIGQLQRAWRKLIKLHPMLRTIFIEGVTFGTFAIQVTLTEGLPETVIVECEATGLEELPCPDRLLRQQGKQSLPQLTIYQSNTGQVFTLLDINHAVTDATSISIMKRDLARLYSAKEEASPSRRLNYSEYISYLQKGSKSSALDFWKSYLAGVNPCLFTQLNYEHRLGSDQLWQSVSIELGHVARYNQFCGSTGITLANVFKLAWSLVLRSFTASNKICFGYMASGRDVPLMGIEDAVGPFINILLCYLEILPERSLLGTLHDLQSDFINTLPHQRVSLAEIRHSLNLAGDDALFNTTLTFPPQVEEEETALIKVMDVYRQDPGEYDIVIEVGFREKEINATMKYWTQAFSELQARGVASTLSHVISQIINRPQQTVGEIQMLSAIDEARIRRWNKVLPQPSKLCVHELIDQQCVARPDAVAVCAWDGSLTYRELQDLSTRLALHLVSRGVKPEAFVPLCLSKSYFTPVAMLAVVKAGGAFVLLDPSHPLERLQAICNQLRSQVIITSAEHSELATQLVSGIVMVEKGAVSTWPFLQAGYHKLPSVATTDVLCVVFTSGSTGQPKGVVIEHGPYSTNALAHTRLFGLTHESRTLQFAGYSFDLSIFEHFNVLVAGGCLCIPSESDRYSQLAQAAARMEVNSMMLTPSVARMLLPGQIPTLQRLTLCGEPMHQTDIDTWSPSVRLMNAYGPAESTIGCSVQPSMERTDPRNIGWPLACAFWVTNPDDPHQLLPVGAVGELLVEGPILARGYLNDPERTAASFIEAPKWLQTFRGKSIDTEESRLHQTKPGRMYKTGDLVQYLADGSLRYVGRKDTQVKLRGQRIELGEVEAFVDKYFPKSTGVAAALITPVNGSSPLLVAFICWRPGAAEADGSPLLLPATDQFRQAISEAKPCLHNTLPSYLVPEVFLPVSDIPLSRNGKTDRKRLQAEAAALTREQMKSYSTLQAERRQPRSEMETILQQLLTEILNLSADEIQMDDDFFRIGGDSIVAMKLASLAAQRGLAVSMKDIFSYPKLSDLAKRIPKSPHTVIEAPAPFSLIDDHDNREAILELVKQTSAVNKNAVEDMYPCTALQEGLMALTAKRDGAYLAESKFHLPIDVDLNRLKAAWTATLAANPILRTRIVQLEARRCYQVVIRGDSHWRVYDDIQAYNRELRTSFGLGKPMVQLAVIKQSQSVAQYDLMLRIHHAIYDGWSFPMILNQVQLAYEGQKLHTRPFSPFITYVQKSHPQATDFWQSELADVATVVFPALPSPGYQPAPNSSITRILHLGQKLNDSFTLAVRLRLVWALVVSQYTGSNDVVFGITATGRGAPVPGIEQMTGPTQATFPQRISINPEQKVTDTLRQIQDRTINTIPYEQFGLQNISQCGESHAAACQFQTLLVIQPPVKQRTDKLFAEEEKLSDLYAFSTYALVLVCQLSADTVEIEATFDRQVVSERRMDQILRQVDHIFHQIYAQDLDKSIADIKNLHPEDLAQLASWNTLEADPLPQHCVHHAIQDYCQTQPDAPAVCAWDGDLSYKVLDDLSSALAGHLQRRGVCPETVVPLYFEKSRWTPVAMLGVIRAGGAFVFLDPGHPFERLQQICQEVKAKVVVASREYTEAAVGLVGNKIVITLSDDDSEWRQTHNADFQMASSVSSCNALYVAFTSGSTGKPKGAIIEHRSFYLNAIRHNQLCSLSRESRVLQFSGYAFDASIMEHLNTLVAGGCICIPSEFERNNRLKQVITEMKVNWMALTPSVARTLVTPNELTTLQTLLLGGELMSHDDITTWSYLVRLVNAYGPTECAVVATIQPSISPQSDPRNIGRPITSAVWVTNPKDPKQLLPIGAVGELLIEGPIVGRGYLNDAERTAASFVRAPQWLHQFRGESAAQSRLYRTGDMGQYQPDGSILYLGRRDGQIKLRGQRIELAEVEHHVSLNFKGSRKIIADVIRAAGSDARQLLVALVARSPSTSGEISHGTRAILGSPEDAEFQKLVASIRSRLGRTLPKYMVPAIFIPLNQVPLTKTGKTDRRLLHQLVSALPTEELAAFGRYQKVYKAPNSGTERTLQKLFARVLALNMEHISADDNFFQIGGDSIVAMKLVGEAREANVFFSVADVFVQPVLCELAKLVRSTAEQPASIAAFTLLPEKEHLRIRIQRAAAESCSLDEDEIDDIYPCTPLQEGLISLTALKSGMYTGQLTYKLADTVDISQFQAAWQSTIDAHPILRTRIIQTEADGTFQVVLKPHPITWSRNPSVENYLREDMAQRMTLGQPLARFALIQSEHSQDSSSFMVLTLHHALYDGYSLRLLLRHMDAAYHGMQVQAYPYAPFIKFATTQDTAAVQAFWQSEFAGLEAALFPVLPGSAVAKSAGTRCSIDRSVPVDIPADATVTLSNTIRLAWAIMVSAYTDCEDVVFGVTLSGRNAPVPHIEDITGPTFTTVPFRIRVVADETVEAALAAVQQHATQMIAFEQTGLQHIRKISPEAAAACDFRTHLGVQLALDTADPSTLMQTQNPSGAEFEAFASYPLVLVCGLTSQNDTVHVNANFDPSIISSDKMGVMAAQFAHVLQQLCKNPAQHIGAIELVSPDDSKQLHEWNSILPSPRFSTVHDLVLQHARERPMAAAVSFASCQLTFGDLDALSGHLAQHIAERGVKKGVFVPLCFEKSTWPVVAMMAVLRAGGTCVNIDPALPAGRVRDILREVAPIVALSSPSRQQLLENCAPGSLTVLTAPLHPEQAPETTWIAPAVKPDDAAFIIFTSGSTGKPKGIVMEHTHLTTSIHYHSSTLQVDKNSRSLHFASYAFDASISEIFTTLVNGGCVYIPSEHERINDLAGFINRHNINWATLTPSVVNLLRPEEIPNLRTLVLVGEAVRPEIVDIWAGRLQLINGYGPAEASICAAAGRIPASGWCIGTIGPMVGSVGWVTLPSDPNRLAPLGTVGELLIEGPIVARKYLNQSENQSGKPQSGFIKPPPWLCRFRYPNSPGRLYQSGDLVQLTKGGWIRYSGRKDTQVKLHGQRIELGEVEHQVRSHFAGACEVVAEVITRGTGQSALLLAFVCYDILTEQMEDSDSIFALADKDFQHQANMVRTQLQDSLPPYMVPSALLPLRKLPSTPTGKTDRKRLREEASKLSSSEFKQYEHGVGGPRRAPSTETEVQLQQLWVRVLNISYEDVGADDSFFRLGGNSIGAMLLVSMARQLGLELSVADVFKCPKLCELAVAVKRNTPRAARHSKSHQPCSLFNVTDHETFIREIATGQPFQPADVVNVLPTTEFQREFLHRNQRHYFMVMIPGSVHQTRLKTAVRALLEKYEILRTVFVPLKDTIAQVTLRRIRSDLQIVETTDLKTAAKGISEQDSLRNLPSGTPNFQVTLVVGSGNHHALILRISHAQYDGVSFQHLYTDLTSAYQGNALAPTIQFSDYMKCRAEAKSSHAWNFWKGFLQGSSMTSLDPHRLGGQAQPTSKVLIHQRKSITSPTTPRDITMATVIKAAWALVLARMTRQQDLVFGQVVNGRGVPIEGVEKILGPCVNIVPVRVTIQPEWPALVLLSHVQDQHTRTLDFETTDLEDIVRQSTPWPHNTRFDSIVQHQSIPLDPEISFDSVKCETDVHTIHMPDNLYAVSIPQGQNLIIEIIASNKVLSAENADRLLSELGQRVLDLTSYPSKRVSDML